MKKFILSLVLMALPCAGFTADEISRLTLQGNGTVSAEPDEGYITVGCEIVAPTATQALTTNSGIMTTLYGTLADLGVARKDIKTIEFSVGEHFTSVPSDDVDGNGRRVYMTKRDGWQVSNTINITVCKLDTFGDVLSAVVSDGANRVSGISFGSSKAAEYQDAARAAAVADAIKRAKTLATGLQVNLARVITIQEASGMNRRANVYSATADAAPGRSMPTAPTSGGSLTFEATVNVQWEIKPMVTVVVELK